MRAPSNLNALRALEAAARHLSFVAAGEELRVTPTAVGQLVRGLEDSLSVRLFHRSRSGQARLVPTEATRQAMPDLQAGFAQLSSAVATLRTADPYEHIDVSVPRPFAERWLLPKMLQFRQGHPDYDLRIDTSTAAPDQPSTRSDISICYGEGRWPGWHSVLLVEDAVLPVCHPIEVAGHPPPVRGDMLQAVPLIHDASMEAGRSVPGWQTWFGVAGLDGIRLDRGIHIDDPGAVVSAAVAGQGVALARRALVGAELAAARLISPFGPTLDCRSNYYAVCRPELPDGAAAAFRDWLIREAGINS